MKNNSVNVYNMTETEIQSTTFVSCHAVSNAYNVFIDVFDAFKILTKIQALRNS